jgi:hypothetical protein
MKEEGWGEEEKKITFRQVTGTKGESELTLPYGYPSWKKKRGIEGKGKEKEEKRTINR